MHTDLSLLLHNNLFQTHFIWGVPAAFGACKNQHVAIFNGYCFVVHEAQFRYQCGQHLNFAENIAATILALWYWLLQWCYQQWNCITRITILKMKKESMNIGRRMRAMLRPSRLTYRRIWPGFSWILDR